MAILSINIPGAVLSRIGTIIPRLGYVYNAADTGSTDPQQQEEFVRQFLITYLRDVTIDQERGLIQDTKRAISEQARIDAEASASLLVPIATGSIT